MSPEERVMAERWYQAVREWRTREDYRATPVAPNPSGPPARRPWGCPVCRSLKAGDWDQAILDARARGLDSRPILQRIAEEARLPYQVVAWHASHHLDLDPPALIGEWARAARRVYVLLPTGWHRAEEVMAVIAEAPDGVRQRLERARMGGGPLTLLDGRGQVKRGGLLPWARAALWLAERLGGNIRP